jgi:predicted kinase
MDHSGDHELAVLIHFYKSYRALVRAKVNCFQLKENELNSESEKKIIEKIRRYIHLGYRYAVEFTRPTLWIVCGMIAAGKSTLAKELSKKLDVALWRSDAVRKKLFEIEPGRPQVAGFQQDIYTEHATALTYGKLLGLAQQEIEHGRSLILDASFAKRHWRTEAVRLAAEKDADIIFVECQAPEKTLKKRLTHRNSRASVSDARLKHFQSFKNRFEALDEIPIGSRLRIDTSRPLQECMQGVLASDFFLLSETRSLRRQSGMA